MNFPVEVRFVPADDISMSPACGRDSCYLGAYVASRKWTVPYHRDFENLMHDFAGRPHWGKVHYRSGTELAELHGAYERWWSVRDRYDPDGVFLTDDLVALRP